MMINIPSECTMSSVFEYYSNASTYQRLPMPWWWEGRGNQLSVQLSPEFQAEEGERRISLVYC